MAGKIKFKKRTIKKPLTKLKNVIKKVNKLYNEAELKHYDLTTAGISIDEADNSHVICLSSMAQGNTEITRSGLKISPTSLNVRVASNNPDAALSCITRILVVRDYEDKQKAGSPTVADIIEDITTAPAVKVLSPHKWTVKKRYSVLYDRCISSGISTTSNNSHIVNISGKSKVNYNIYFDGPLNTDNSFNHLWLIIINDAVAGHDSEYWYYTRLTYRDM